MRRASFFDDLDNRAWLLGLLSTGMSIEEAGRRLPVTSRTIHRFLRENPPAHRYFLNTRVKSEPVHGTPSAYGYYGCRCDVCRAGNAARHRGIKEKLAERVPPKHGTPNAYGNYGCRCDECRAFKEHENRKMRDRLRGRRPPKHGVNGYTSYGCRCDVCREAAREYGMRRRSA